MTIAPATHQQMTHEQVLRTLIGLLLGLFVAMLSGTVVTNALPTIVADLGGGQGAYTGIVTATLLALTVSTPIWGKLADLYNRKLLMQSALGIYAAGSVLAGLSPTTEVLIGARVLQGIGAGGTVALVQTILAAIVSPRERGRYTGYIGATFAVATISGPLVGGVTVDTLGWRWCFFIGIPVAAVAMVALQRTLTLPDIRREVVLDVRGASLIVAGAGLLLLWVSLAGQTYAWASVQTALMVPGAVLLLAAAVWAESRAVEPVIPLHLFRERTIVLAVVASVFVGAALFAGTVYLSQYFQLARGHSATEAGLLGIPLVLGLSISSLVVGRIITRTGLWKRWLVTGAALLTAGLAGLSRISEATPYGILALSMAVVGIGLGAVMQNLVLSVQNTVSRSELGSATATVTFFRSLGGALGVSAMGALLSHHVRTSLPGSGDSGAIPDISALSPAARGAVEGAYGDAVALVFLVATPLAAIALVAVSLIREVPLRNDPVGEPDTDPEPQLVHSS